MAFLVIVLDCCCRQSRVRVRRVIITFLGILFAGLSDWFPSWEFLDIGRKKTLRIIMNYFVTAKVKDSGGKRHNVIIWEKVFLKLILTVHCLKFSSERDNWKWFSHCETLFSVNEQRVGFDFEVVLQPGFVSKQVLENWQNICLCK